jgi:hypothetical protein
VDLNAGAAYALRPRARRSHRRLPACRRAQLAAIAALAILFLLFWFGVSLVANDPVGLVISFVPSFSSCSRRGTPDRCRRVAKLVTLGIVGADRRFGRVLQWSTPEFEVRSEAPVSVGLDGEALVLMPPLRFVSMPGVLRVRLPRHARGASPAAAAVPLTRRNLSALLRIAVGRPVHPPSQRRPDSGP